MSTSASAGTAGPTRVLVVDDEEPVRELVATVLRYEGYEVSQARTGREAIAEAARTDPAMVVLDVMLPDLDGFQVLTRLRERGHDVPVLFLTARDSTEDRVAGLTLGGDDYVTKPFSLEELVARVRTVLRRDARRLAQEAAREPVLRVADLELDEDARLVRRAGRIVELTATEFELLRYLMRNAGMVLSKAQILDRVWHYDFGGQDNIVEVYIGYLRRKLDTVEPKLIQTVRGVGYVLRPPQR